MLLNPSPPDSCQEINGHMTLMHTGAGHIPLCGIFLKRSELMKLKVNLIKSPLISSNILDF